VTKPLIDHMILERKFTVQELIDCGCKADEEERVITFPLYNASGKMTGYQEYRPDASKEKNNVRGESRYWTYVTKGELGYWGHHSLKEDVSALFITEGVMDAARLTSLGCQAIATLSNNPKHMKRLIDIWKSKYFVVTLLDNDAAGQKLANFGHAAYIMDDDVSSASDQELDKMFKDVKDMLGVNNDISSERAYQER